MISSDPLKYVTVYEGALTRDHCEELLSSFYTAPFGDGYILEAPNEWEDQDGLRRRPLLERYRIPEGLDYGILGGPVFKDFKAYYPNPKDDDTAYQSILRVLSLLEGVVSDYVARWSLDINIIQHAPLEFRYYQGPQGVGPHSDYSGHLHLHPKGAWGNQDPREEKDIANQTFAYNLYLNDDYGEGGEITVRVYHKQLDGTYTESDFTEGSHKPKAGDIVIFPCAFPYEHSVSPIGEGVKRWMINANAIQDQPPMWQFS